MNTADMTGTVVQNVPDKADKEQNRDLLEILIKWMTQVHSQLVN